MRSSIAAMVLLLPAVCFAEEKTVTLDEVFATWDKATAKEHPGVSIMPPQSLRFSASYLEGPKPCPNGLLVTIMGMHGRADFLAKTPVGHCIRIASQKGRVTEAYIEDLLVPGLLKDAKVGGMLDLHADLFGYTVEGDRSRNAPVLMIFEFEPK